jgi:hypothetical protein
VELGLGGVARLAQRENARDVACFSEVASWIGPRVLGEQRE